MTDRQPAVLGVSKRLDWIEWPRALQVSVSRLRPSVHCMEPGAHEPPKERVTPVPCKYKLFRKLT